MECSGVVSGREKTTPEQERHGPKEPTGTRPEAIGLRHVAQRVIIGEEAETDGAVVKRRRRHDADCQPPAWYSRVRCIANVRVTSSQRDDDRADDDQRNHRALDTIARAAGEVVLPRQPQGPRGQPTDNEQRRKTPPDCPAHRPYGFGDAGGVAVNARSVNVRPSASSTDTNRPPGDPSRSGRTVTFTSSPVFTVVDFHPARTRYAGDVIS